MAFPGTYNFNYYRGDRHEFVVKPKDSNGATYDLDDFNGASFTIANKRGTGSTKYNASATINTSTDTITCVVLPAIGSQLSAGTYVYEIQITADSSTVITLLTGSITVTDSINGVA
jgi:hypothetical protein